MSEASWPEPCQDTGELRSVARPRLFETSHVPPQLGFCIAALHALQRESYGWMGTAVSSTAFFGLAVATCALTVGVVSASPDIDLLFNVLLIGLLVATVGIVLLGGLTVATGMLPRWCGLALMAGSPVGVFLTMLPSAALGGASLIGGTFQALGGVPWVVVGYAVFRAGGRQAQQHSRVR